MINHDIILFVSLMVKETFKDIKMDNQNRKSKKNKQCNGQQKKETRANNNLQSYAQKTKERTTQAPIKIGVNYDVLEEEAVPAPYVAPVVLLLLQAL